MLEVVLAVLKTGIGSVLILIFGVVSTKIFALYLGPAGIGLLSLLQQTRDTFLSLTSFHNNTALVQGLANRQGQLRRRYSLSVLFIVLMDVVLLASVLAVFAPQIASSIFHRSDASAISLVRWLMLPLILDTFLAYLSGILNGYRAIGRLALVQAVSAIVTALLAYPVTVFVKSGNSLAFIGMMTASSLTGVGLAFGFVRRAGWLPVTGTNAMDLSLATFRQDGAYFLSFAFTIILIGVANTGTILAVRSAIVANMGLSAAGIFDASWTISMMYISLALSSFGTYYLPTFAQAADDEERRQIITRMFRIILFVIVPIIASIILFKSFIIRILYTKDFLNSVGIIRWMVIGDYLKATSWVFGVTISASADKKALFWAEVLWQAGFLLCSLISIFAFKSIEGLGLAFMILYVGYLCFTSHYAYRHFGFILPRSLVLQWLAGLGLLLTLSFMTWTASGIRWGVVFAGGAMVAVYANWLVSAKERTQLLKLAREKLSIG